MRVKGPRCRCGCGLPQLPGDGVDHLVDPGTGALEGGRAGANHLYELRHVLPRNLAELAEGLEAAEQVLFPGNCGQVLQDSHGQLHGNVVKHLKRREI